MPNKILALILVLGWMCAGESFGGEKIWASLYFAENSPPKTGARLAPEVLHRRLHEVFGFKHYELVKSQTILLNHEWEQWFVPRSDFFLRLEPLHGAPGEPKVVAWEVYKDGFIVAKGNYTVSDPLFINGPDFKEGRFLFVVEAR